MPTFPPLGKSLLPGQGKEDYLRGELSPKGNLYFLILTLPPSLSHTGAVSSPQEEF